MAAEAVLEMVMHGVRFVAQVVIEGVVHFVCEWLLDGNSRRTHKPPRKRIILFSGSRPASRRK